MSSSGGLRDRLNTGGSHSTARERTVSISFDNDGSEHFESTAATSFASPLRSRLNTGGSNAGRGRGNSVELFSQSQLQSAIDDEITADKSKKSARARKLIDWIQSWTIPTAAASRRSTRLALIQGLDRVYFGTVAAADVVRIAGWQPNRYLWYMLSGAVCDVGQFLVDRILYKQKIFTNSSTCWAVSFGMSILFRHTSHRYLVFGLYVGGYYRSLARMYGAYSVSIVLSTVFNYYVTQEPYNQYINHTMAWFVTMMWTGVANYFILKRTWGAVGGGAGGETKPNVSPAVTQPRPESILVEDDLDV